MKPHYLGEPFEQWIGKWFARRPLEYLYFYDIDRADKVYPIRCIQLSSDFVGYEQFPLNTEFDEVRPRDAELRTALKIFFEREIPK
jgi:hypothetical protein